MNHTNNDWAESLQPFFKFQTLIYFTVFTYLSTTNERMCPTSSYILLTAYQNKGVGATVVSEQYTGNYPKLIYILRVSNANFLYSYVFLLFFIYIKYCHPCCIHILKSNLTLITLAKINFKTFIKAKLKKIIFWKLKWVKMGPCRVRAPLQWLEIGGKTPYPIIYFLNV